MEVIARIFLLAIHSYIISRSNKPVYSLHLCTGLLKGARRKSESGSRKEKNEDPPAIRTLREEAGKLQSVQTVRFVLWGEDAFQIHKKVLETA